MNKYVANPAASCMYASDILCTFMHLTNSTILIDTENVHGSLIEVCKFIIQNIENIFLKFLLCWYKQTKKLSEISSGDNSALLHIIGLLHNS